MARRPRIAPRLGRALRAGLAAAAVAGCASAPAPGALEQARCTRDGLQPGSPAFSACVERLAATRCPDGTTSAFHVKPHPEPSDCWNAP
jgi:hypothetical protein